MDVYFSSDAFGFVDPLCAQMGYEKGWRWVCGKLCFKLRVGAIGRYYRSKYGSVRYAFLPLLFSVGKVLEDREAIIQQKNEWDKTSYQLKYDNPKKERNNTRWKDWYDWQKCIGSKMAKELAHCKSRLKELCSCVFNWERKVSCLRAELSASRSTMSKLLCRGKVSERNGFPIRALIRQLSFNCEGKIQWPGTRFWEHGPLEV